MAFSAGLTVVGTVTGPGAPIFLVPPLPLLPPPVDLFPPPAPPPPAPAALLGAGMTQYAYYAEVPVVPEADYVILLLGGLVALGVGAAWRARRRDA